MPDLRARFDTGGRFAVATVVRTFSSAPRLPGATMAVSAAGKVVGSVSGGCVEGAVYEAACEAISDGLPRFERYGVSDDEAFGVGLTCGGTIEVFVNPVDADLFPDFQRPEESIRRGEPVALATVLTGARVGRRLVVWTDDHTALDDVDRLHDAIIGDARAMLEQGLSEVRHYGEDGQRRLEDVLVFIQSFSTAPRLLVFGAIDFAAAVTQIGKFLGYRVTVCDARPVFATPERFPTADEVVVSRPHKYLVQQVAEGAVDSRTAICVLTHDPKFDVPLLEVALRADAAYLGAMGSRRTDADRRARLPELGVAEEALERLSSPIGLDIGAVTPEETAISIASELIASRHGKSGHRLSRVSGDIHDMARH
ncbi:XdhC family protein [Nocardioides sp. B-3]|uniref:XdhC family protein n=1 Tax=Nocardioides sp. B-3 TaxID=2895565 RepID=UPI002152136B|nr:XdhC/CoxI family protein [Nocardioides sp. B-3]UUZ59020.1 XdhC family protein [Nocardioides sp. B-3]